MYRAIGDHICPVQKARVELFEHRLFLAARDSDIKQDKLGRERH